LFTTSSHADTGQAKIGHVSSPTIFLMVSGQNSAKACLVKSSWFHHATYIATVPRHRFSIQQHIESIFGEFVAVFAMLRSDFDPAIEGMSWGSVAKNRDKEKLGLVAYAVRTCCRVFSTASDSEAWTALPRCGKPREASGSSRRQRRQSPRHHRSNGPSRTFKQ